MARSLAQYRQDLIDDGRTNGTVSTVKVNCSIRRCAVSGGIGGNGGRGVGAVRQRAECR